MESGLGFAFGHGAWDGNRHEEVVAGAIRVGSPGAEGPRCAWVTPLPIVFPSAPFCGVCELGREAAEETGLQKYQVGAGSLRLSS